MDTILIILGIICLITGIAGCFLPVLPGPPVAYLGILFLHFTDKVQYSGTQLLVAYRHHHIGLRLFRPDAGQQI